MSFFPRFCFIHRRDRVRCRGPRLGDGALFPAVSPSEDPGFCFERGRAGSFCWGWWGAGLSEEAQDGEARPRSRAGREGPRPCAASRSQPRERGPCRPGEARGFVFRGCLGEAWGGLLPLPRAHVRQKKPSESLSGGSTLLSASLRSPTPPLFLGRDEPLQQRGGELKRRALLFGDPKENMPSPLHFLA